jgi:hypothetical protein
VKQSPGDDPNTESRPDRCCPLVGCRWRRRGGVPIDIREQKDALSAAADALEGFSDPVVLRIESDLQETAGLADVAAKTGMAKTSQP